MTDEESLRAAIAEEVSLAPHRSAWAGAFKAERERLLDLFPDELQAVEHIGSTAVPGLAAKPILDILAGVASMRVADALVEPLCRAGYSTSAEFNATLADRRWLMRWADGHRTHHLHVVVLRGRAWTERLAFRDALLGDAPLAARYEALKRRLGERHRADRESYTDSKADFVNAAVARFLSAKPASSA